MQFLSEKPSERMSIFWTVCFRFLKSESEHNVGFPHMPSLQVSLLWTRVDNTARRLMLPPFIDSAH